SGVGAAAPAAWGDPVSGGGGGGGGGGWAGTPPTMARPISPAPSDVLIRFMANSLFISAGSSPDARSNPALEENDHVESERQLTVPRPVVERVGELRPVVADFGSNPQPRLGPDVQPQCDFMERIGDAGGQPVGVPEDLAPPHADDLVVEL